MEGGEGRWGTTSLNNKAREVPITSVPELLGSNIIPSTSQTRTVLDTILDTQSHISQIDNELAGLIDSVNELQSKRTDRSRALYEQS